jgi:hypothetical protein
VFQNSGCISGRKFGTYTTSCITPQGALGHLIINDIDILAAACVDIHTKGAQ